MAKKYDLHHWDNSHVKNHIIVALCAMKNDIYLVYNEKTPVATFQTRKTEKTFLFQKSATVPAFSKVGIGSYCVTEIANDWQKRMDAQKSFVRSMIKANTLRNFMNTEDIRFTEQRKH